MNCTEASSWVMPSTMSAPERSLKRSSSEPMESNRPDLRHRSAGMVTGKSTSWPSMRFISCRMMFSIFEVMRFVMGNSVNMPLPTGLM